MSVPGSSGPSSCSAPSGWSCGGCRFPSPARASSCCGSRPPRPAAPTSRSCAAAAIRGCSHVPTPFGHEMAGTVAAVGKDQERWEVGDRVVVANSAPCGACEWCLRGRENLCAHLQYLNGAFSEYLLVPRRFAEVSTYPVPDELPLEIAALAEPLACVLHGLEVCALERPLGDGRLWRRPDRAAVRERAGESAAGAPRGAGRPQPAAAGGRHASSARTRPCRWAGTAARPRACGGTPGRATASTSPSRPPARPWPGRTPWPRHGPAAPSCSSAAAAPAPTIPLDTHSPPLRRADHQGRLPPPPRHLPARPRPPGRAAHLAARGPALRRAPARRPRRAPSAA